ncbi:hypothetical protein COO60DRAFT_801701 [Scenedesmus sp. NREL 46B-D3]|nr:hypothetical protein COO60DRAFT_801701 [Scenedesmus sp. NREL 46B-D3]
MSPTVITNRWLSSWAASHMCCALQRLPVHRQPAEHRWVHHGSHWLSCGGLGGLPVYCMLVPCPLTWMFSRCLWHTALTAVGWSQAPQRPQPCAQTTLVGPPPCPQPPASITMKRPTQTSYDKCIVIFVIIMLSIHAIAATPSSLRPQERR